MNILHYSLGFPPFRRGGMTQYCLDLIKEQAKSGYEVALLWPGRLYNLGENSRIEKTKSYNLQNNLYCKSYELVNPLPVSLMDGIQNPEIYLIKKKKKAYSDFFRINKFDVLHIHTFMGLPMEVIDIAQSMGIKTVFTSHDYYPLCPRCNFFHDGKDCVNDHNCADCVMCNQNGLSFNKMKLLQSNLYKYIKETMLIKKLRAKHNRKMYDTTEFISKKEVIDTKRQMNYQKLRQRNIELLENMNVVHFNSTNTLYVYQKCCYSGQNAKVISISNGAIGDHKKKREVKGQVRFGYLGPLTTHKGYNWLKNVCDTLWSRGQHNFEVHIFVEIDNPSPYMVCHKPYKYSELSSVMDKFDILVAPSEWEETFGFTVLEALSFGIPVIVSDKVGAKDLIIEGKNGFVVDEKNKPLRKCLNELIKMPQIIDGMNTYIVEKFKVKTMNEHAKEIEHLYQEICM